MTYQTLILEPFSEMMTKVLSLFPTVFTALLILTVGWMAALLIEKVFTQFFKAIKFDDFCAQLGITRVLENGAVKHKPSKLLSTIIYMLAMVMVLIMTVKSLGLMMASALIDKVIAYIPNVISGALVLIIGMLIAKLVSSLVFVTAKNTEMPAPEVLSRLTKWAIILYVTTMYLTEIGFGGLFVGTNYTIFLAGIVLAFALAFGIAGRNIAAKYLDVFNIKKTS